MTRDWPAGTGTITVFFCLVCPLPRQEWHGLEMTVPLPPQWRQVERITNGPVFTVSYRDEDNVFSNTTQIHFEETARGRDLTMPEPLQ